MTDVRDPDDDLLAAELALDLLDTDERRAAERREATEPAFARAVDRWRGWALDMLAGPDAPVPDWLWRSITARLPANDAGKLTRWRVATGVAAAAASVLGIVALRPAEHPVPPPRPAPTAAPAPLVATLSGESRASVTVVIDRATHRLLLAPVRLSTPGRSPELWVIADGTPRALGLVDAGAPGHLQPPPGTAVLLTPGATLAVSVEPVGGSRTGKPTGPVILTGVAKAT